MGRPMSDPATVTGDGAMRLSAAPVGPARVRDPRLDFFRGIAMFIIFIAHTPRDAWALWIPARFGFSDATETFVFCSGMASALAFGGVFASRGWWMGAARIVYRVWQVYWAHIALFLAIFVLMVAFDAAGDTLHGERWKGSYVASLNLVPLIKRPDEQLLGLLTLTYVPNYFDILPMYLVILALIPLVMALARVSLWAVAFLVAGLWSLANLHLVGLDPVNFPAEPWSQRAWFFNPLGWQLVFFTGFAFMRGWIPAPPVDRRLVILAAFVTLATVPFAWHVVLREVPALREAAGALKPLTGKTSFGILRYVHFLSTAYLAWVAVGPLGSRLQGWGAGQVIVDIVRKVGQQSLAVFVASLVVAQLVGMAFRVNGNDWPMLLVGNLCGFAVLIGVAYTVAWFKGQPWRKPAMQPPRREVAGSPTQSPVSLPDAGRVSGPVTGVGTS